MADVISHMTRSHVDEITLMNKEKKKKGLQTSWCIVAYCDKIANYMCDWWGMTITTTVCSEEIKRHVNDKYFFINLFVCQ